MSKKALAVSLKDLTAYFDANEKTHNHPKMRMVRLKGTNDPFFKLPTFLADRDTCETDTSIVQLLPYISLAHIDGRLKVSVAVYKRGNKGTEERLRNSSIGYGGHVEEEATAQKPLIDVLTDCAVREIKEETGIDMPEWKIKDSLSISTIFHDTSEESKGVARDP
jgi:predicted NUDIX family phosphoesterase